MFRYWHRHAFSLHTECRKSDHWFASDLIESTKIHIVATFRVRYFWSWAQNWAPWPAKQTQATSSNTNLFHSSPSQQTNSRIIKASNDNGAESPPAPMPAMAVHPSRHQANHHGMVSFDLLLSSHRRDPNSHNVSSLPLLYLLLLFVPLPKFNLTHHPFLLWPQRQQHWNSRTAMQWRRTWKAGDRCKCFSGNYFPFFIFIRRLILRCSCVYPRMKTNQLWQIGWISWGVRGRR